MSTCHVPRQLKYAFLVPFIATVVVALSSVTWISIWFQCRRTTHKQTMPSLNGHFPVCPYRRVRAAQCGNFEFSRIITAVCSLILRPKPLPRFYRPLRGYTCLRLYQLALFHQIITVQYLNKPHSHIPTTYCSRNE